MSTTATATVVDVAALKEVDDALHAAAERLDDLLEAVKAQDGAGGADWWQLLGFLEDDAVYFTQIPKIAIELRAKALGSVPSPREAAVLEALEALSGELREAPLMRP